MPRKDGHRLREHLEQAAKQGASLEGFPKEEPLPESVTHLWGWFWELDAGRQEANPLAYSEIESWMRLTGAVAGPWEVATIKAMDTVRMTESRRIENGN